MDRSLLRPLLLIALAAGVFLRCGHADGPRIALVSIGLALALALCRRRRGELASWIACLILLATSVDYALRPAMSSPLFGLGLAGACLSAAIVLLAPAWERRRGSLRALLVLLAVTGALFLGEVAARRVFPRDLHALVPTVGSASARPYRPDPSLVHAPVPGFRGRFVHTEYKGERFASNSDGFRDEEWPRDWPAEEARVLVLGDSMVVGFGVEAHESMPALLQAELRAAHPGRALRVLNAGVANYGARHERVLLERLLPRTLPTAVLCVFYDGNDLGDARRHALETEPGRLEAFPAKPHVQRAPTLFERDYWSRYSQLFASVETRLARRFPWIDPPRPIAGYDDLPRLASREPAPDVLEELELTREAFSEMHALCTAAGVRFLVARLPARTQVEPRTFARLFAERGIDPAGYERARPGSAVVAACRAEGIEVLDLLPLLEWDGAGPSPDYFLEGHLNRAGNRRVAAALAVELLGRL